MRPEALEWSTENCTVGRAMAVLGEKWTFLVLREVFNGVRRFDDMKEHAQVPRQVLANRLSLLVEQEILRREAYREPGERTRHEYRLTEKGFDLYPVLVAIHQWGERYLADPEGSAIKFIHHDCGATVSATLSCADGHVLASNREVIPRPGPGARRRSVAAGPGQSASTS